MAFLEAGGTSHTWRCMPLTVISHHPASNPILGGSKALRLCIERQPLIYCHTNKGCYYPHVKVNVQQRQPFNKDTATKTPHNPAVAVVMLYSQQTQAKQKALSLSPEVLPEAVYGGFTKLTVKAEFFLLFDYRASWAPKSDLHITGVNQYKLLIQSARKAPMHASGSCNHITLQVFPVHSSLLCPAEPHGRASRAHFQIPKSLTHQLTS